MCVVWGPRQDCLETKLQPSASKTSDIVGIKRCWIMRTKFHALALFIVCLLVTAAPGFAHHAWRGYDMKNVSTMKGTVTGFDFGNPHVWMNLDVTNDKGEVEKWSAGGPSPSRMANAGWTKDTLHPGDQITIVGNRISDGTYKMRLSKVVLASGRELMCYGHEYGP